MDELLQRITVDAHNRVWEIDIRGLRYSVEWLLELLSSGMSQQAILEDYEDLELADVYAALAYATKPSQVKRIVVVLLNFRRIRNGLYL